MSVKTALVAEKELQKYSKTNPEDKLAAFIFFMKNVCDFDLYPHQILIAEQYFKNARVFDVKPPRSGKTKGKEAVNLFEMATNSNEDLRIYVPKYKQGKDALSYHYNWIIKSKLLNAYIRMKSGKKVLSTVNYEFYNGSNAEIYSVRGEIEGHNVTIMDIDEFDSWKWETFQDDVMRRGGAKNRNGLPTRIRISGTIRGKENIFRLVTDKKYKTLFENGMITAKNNILGIPAGIKLDVYMMQQFGALDEEFIEFQKDIMSPDEWARTNLLEFTEATNFIHSAYIWSIQKKADEWGLLGVPFSKGGQYKPEGIVAFGFDCGHAGEKKTSSHYSLQIFEQIGMYRRWLNGFRWPPDVDGSKLEKDLLEIFAFYRPEGGYGDALGYRIIASINDKAWKEGITSINRNDFPENTPGNWEKWWFSPLWNNGKNKYLYYSSLQHNIHHGKLFFPYYEIEDKRHEALAVRKLIKNLLNIREEQTAGTYPKYYGHDAEIGDDDADAAGMANLWLDIHVQGQIDFNLISTAGQTRQTSGLIDSVLNEVEIDREDYANF